LASGSTGNAILLRGPRPILLDAGLPTGALEARLAEAGCAPHDLGGIILTHEHSDHARGAADLARRHSVPLVATPGTLAAVPSAGEERLALPYGQDLDLHGFHVRLFPVAHDAAQPAGVRVERGGRALAYLTDAGHHTDDVAAALSGAHHLLIESNHDPDLLRHGPYPERLKRRIEGGRGHLSNDACGSLLARVVDERTRRVLLHHLSRTNNTPELALATTHAILHRGARPVPELLAAPPRGPFGPFPF
jgi:phosphoribosyl 1,2-cyclic phosphodiesterase